MHPIFPYVILAVVATVWSASGITALYRRTVKGRRQRAQVTR